jgi:hypothetical protein
MCSSGSGKSGGMLSGTIDQDIEHIIEWAQCIIGEWLGYGCWCLLLCGEPS